MRTERIQVDPLHPEVAAIDRAAAVLRAGGLVAMPTETVYGLAAGALDADAVARIFAAKGRPATNPLIVHVRNEAEAQRLTTSWPAEAERLAAAFWPGPLTLVLPKRDTVPDITTAAGPTVALRVPAHRVARALIGAAGVPLAAPSANTSSRISATSAEHVLKMLDGRIELLLDGGPTSGGLESTVLDLSGARPRLLRPGLVGVEALEWVLRAPIEHGPDDATSGPARSPGLHQRHYAPLVPLECVESNAEDQVRRWTNQGQRVGWITHGLRFDATAVAAQTIALPADVAGYSAQLYDALHRMEALAVDRIVIDLPPDKPEWLAVRDRLRRASAPE